MFHLSPVIHADGVIGVGHGEDLIEMIAFDSILKLSRCVASVVAHFEHGDDHYLDGDELCCIREAGEGDNAQKKLQSENALDH
jgi:hypothetical protein